MTEAVVVRLKPELGGRLTARAKRLDGFTRKVGPSGEVLAELKAALARAKLRRTAEKTQVRIYLISGGAVGPIDAEFYSAIGEIVTSGPSFRSSTRARSAGRPEGLTRVRRKPRSASASRPTGPATPRRPL